MRIGSTKQSLELIWGQLRRHPVSVAIMILSVCLVSTAYIIEPYILKLFVDSLSQEAVDESFRQAMWYVVLFKIQK